MTFWGYSSSESGVSNHVGYTDGKKQVRTTRVRVPGENSLPSSETCKSTRPIAAAVLWINGRYRGSIPR
jgi:hypothetical protein